MIPILILVLIVVAVLLSIAYVRQLSHDVAQWHVDPVAAPDPSTPNWYRAVPGGENPPPEFDVSVDDLAVAFDRVVANQPRIELLQDDRSSGGPVTWVQRSAVFGFPDYISVQFLPASSGSGSTVAIFSRARLGQSDLGVNEKRVTAWLAALETQLG